MSPSRPPAAKKAARSESAARKAARSGSAARPRCAGPPARARARRPVSRSRSRTGRMGPGLAQAPARGQPARRVRTAARPPRAPQGRRTGNGRGPRRPRPGAWRLAHRETAGTCGGGGAPAREFRDPGRRLCPSPSGCRRTGATPRARIKTRWVERSEVSGGAKRPVEPTRPKVQRVFRSLSEPRADRPVGSVRAPASLETGRILSDIGAHAHAGARTPLGA